MDDLYKSLKLDPNDSKEVNLEKLTALQKKWRQRLDLAPGGVHRTAEKNLQDISKLEAYLTTDGTEETSSDEENSGVTPPTPPPKPSRTPIYSTETTSTSKKNVFSTENEVTEEEEDQEYRSEKSPLEKKVDALVKQNQVNEALELVLAEVRKGNQNAEINALEANLYHIRGDDDQAYAKYTMVCRLERNETYRAMLLLTGSLCKISPLQQHTDLDESKITSLVALGEYAFLQKDYNKALDYGCSACEMDETCVDGLILTVKSMNALGIPLENYENVFKKIRKLPVDERLLRAQITVLYQHEEYLQIEKICQRIQNDYPNSPLVAFAKERLAAVEDGKFSKAKKDFDGNSAVKSANLEEAMAELNEMIGLQGVKDELEKLRKKVEFDEKRKTMLGVAEIVNDASYHFVFLGNPGTGKTTVARLFAEIFYHLGILEKGHMVETDRGGLVGEFIGQTAPKTQKLIDEAMGGVLFIDEAYALMGNTERDFGKEAIDTLVKAMEDHRRDLIVILAGYREEMIDLMDMNTGLASRFTKYMDFADYSEEELLKIAQSIGKKHHYSIDDIGTKAFLQKIGREMLGAKFGNARAVRNIMNEAMEEKANTNLVGLMTKEDLTTLSAQDFGVDVDETPEERAKKYLEELEALSGLDSVKKDISALIDLISYQKEEEERIGMVGGSVAMHMVFAGNPGTGKTTVARLYGNLLREIGVLKQGQFIEVGRGELVAQYLGQTAPLVKKQCQRAYGGILFVDEAYALCTGTQDSMGKEAVDTLIMEMENNRDKLVVILAGYTDDMSEFLESNPGFASRVSKTLHFSDYGQEELWEIFKGCAETYQMSLASGCEETVKTKLMEKKEKNPKNFGNARDVRNLFDATYMAVSQRVRRDNVQGDDRRNILPEDVL